jgi:hypothetical protein
MTNPYTDKAAELADVFAVYQLEAEATEAIETALQEAAEGTWQPIETAPKDKMIFALCFEDYPQAVQWDQEIDYGSEGISQIWRSVLTDRFVMPTHWMPLPTPPKGESK